MAHTTNYLAEMPAVFNEMSRQFGEQIAGADGVLETNAGKLAADVMAHLALLVDSDRLTAGQLWSAIAAGRGSVGACAELANVARAAQAQLIETEAVHQSPPGRVTDGPEHAQAKGADNADDEPI